MRTILLAVSLFLFIDSIAQNPAVRITVHSESQPLANATVTLKKVKDSSVMKVEITDNTGTVAFDKISSPYFFTVTYSGLAPYRSRYFEKPDSIMRLEVTLQPLAKTMNEVVVETRKPLMTRKFGKLIINTDQLISNTGNSAFEVLEKLPGVSVDASENISLKNKPGTQVMIDGKIQILSGSDLATFLKSIPASAIEQVELITNPSAQYDASGTAGIINIRLKKDLRFGTNALVNLAVGQGMYFRHSGGLNISSRTKKWTVNTILNYAYRPLFNHLTGYNDFSSGNQYLGGTLIDNKRFQPITAFTNRIAADYSASKKTTIGFILSGNFVKVKPDNTNTNTIINANHETQYYSETKNLATEKRPNYAGNFNYKHIFDSTGRQLSVDLDKAYYKIKTVQDYVTKTFGSGPNPATYPDFITSGTQNGDLSIHSVKADFTQPIKQGAIEAGVKASFVETDNNLQFWDRTVQPNKIDSSLSNHFLYKEKLQAAYVNLQKSYKKINFQLGLRMENTIVKGHQIVFEQFFSKQYLQLFPSGAISYTHSPTSQFDLSVSRRIQRPSYSQLNPFRIIINPTYYLEGNPGLNPETSYNFELSYTFKGKYSASFEYSTSRNPMVHVVKATNAQQLKTLETDINLDHLANYAVTFSIPVQYKKLTSLSSAQFYYSRYSGSKDYADFRNGRFTYALSNSTSLGLPKSFTVEANFTYQYKQAYGYMDVNSKWQLNLGLQKVFMQKRATARLSITDLFYTFYDRATINQPGFYEAFAAKRDSRIVNLSLSYKLGRSSAAGPKRRSTGADEEKARAGN